MGTNYGLRSTGLLVFVGRIVSAFTGLLFTVMVARWLDPAGFGTWEVIVTLVTFSAYPVGVVAYWATRDVARGRMVGTTALICGILLSCLGLVMYLGFAFVTYSRIVSSVLPFLLGALLVPLSYWSGVSNSLVQGYRPGAYSYALVTSELAKLFTAYEALYVYRLGIEGVIVALLAAYFVQSAIGTYFVRRTVSEGFDMPQAKRWSRLAWLPAISYLPGVIAVADTFVAATGFGTAIVGYYQVAFIVASVVGYSSGLAFSLYPMLLRGGDERLPAISMEFALLFAIPMAAGGVALAGPILFLFGAKWLPGAMGLAILSAMFVFTTISGILDQTLLGTERADVGDRPNFHALLRSNLIFVPVANILFGVTYVSSLYVALDYAFTHGLPTSSTVALWGSVQFAATFAFLVVKALRARRYARLVPGMSVVYYLLAAAAMAVVLYLVSGLVAPEVGGTVSYGAHLLVVAILGAVVYFGAVYAMDGKTRDMAHSLLRRI